MGRSNAISAGERYGCAVQSGVFVQRGCGVGEDEGGQSLLAFFFPS